jgi:hypothetical protein
LIVNEQQNKNPLIPKFYYGPNFNELFSTNCNCEQKVTFYLKKELEEYRNTSKHLNYTKKDLMIRMLIDEVEK